MPKVNISLNGKTYAVSCDDGQQARVMQLASHIDKTVRAIAGSGAASSEGYLLVLSALMITDELFSLKETAGIDPEKQKRQDEIDVAAVGHLTKRIEQLAERLAS